MAQFNPNIYNAGTSAITSTYQNLGQSLAQSIRANQAREDAQIEQKRVEAMRAQAAANQPQAILAQAIQGNEVTPEQQAIFQAQQMQQGAKQAVDPVSGRVYSPYQEIQLPSGQAPQVAAPAMVTREDFERSAAQRTGGLSPKSRQLSEEEDVKLSAKEAFNIRAEERKAAAERKKTAPKIIAGGKQTLKVIDAMLGHEGLSESVGGIGGLVGRQAEAFPLTENQRDFAGYAKQLKGKSFLQAMETLKGSGQITEIEGAKATQAIARLDQSQTEEGYTEALNDLRDVVSSGMERARTGEVAKDPEVQADGGLNEGRTATNPSTGEKMIFRGGTWQKI